MQVFARAAKYSLFDPAKEMVYIEMDADEKKQGKAAVDLVGSQVRMHGRQHRTQHGLSWGCWRQLQQQRADAAGSGCKMS